MTKYDFKPDESARETVESFLSDAGLRKLWLTPALEERLLDASAAILGSIQHEGSKGLALSGLVGALKNEKFDESSMKAVLDGIAIADNEIDKEHFVKAEYVIHDDKIYLMKGNFPGWTTNYYCALDLPAAGGPDKRLEFIQERKRMRQANAMEKKRRLDGAREEFEGTKWYQVMAGRQAKLRLKDAENAYRVAEKDVQADRDLETYIVTGRDPNVRWYDGIGGRAEAVLRWTDQTWRASAGFRNGLSEWEKSPVLRWTGQRPSDRAERTRKLEELQGNPEYAHVRDLIKGIGLNDAAVSFAYELRDAKNRHQDAEQRKSDAEACLQEAQKKLDGLSVLDEGFSEKEMRLEKVIAAARAERNSSQVEMIAAEQDRGVAEARAAIVNPVYRSLSLFSRGRLRARPYVAAVPGGLLGSLDSVMGSDTRGAIVAGASDPWVSAAAVLSGAYSAAASVLGAGYGAGKNMMRGAGKSLGAVGVVRSFPKGVLGALGRNAVMALPWYLRPRQNVEYKRSPAELLRVLSKPLNINLAAHKRAAEEVHDIALRAGLLS